MSTLKRCMLGILAVLCLATAGGCGSPICNAVTDKFEQCGATSTECNQTGECRNEDQIVNCVNGCSCGSDFASQCITQCVSQCQR